LIIHFFIKITTLKHWSIFALLLCWSCQPSPNEQKSQPIEAHQFGEERQLYSTVLQEDRQLIIYLPESYASSTFTYPVLYVLDGEYEFNHTAGLVDFMSSAGKIPEMIVVGIANTYRSRDLTPEAPNDMDSQQFWGEIGGADKFHACLKDEIIPLIEKEYRTQPYRIVRGQSFGGLFALYDLLFKESLFNAYLTSSPAVEWNEEMLFKRLREPVSFGTDKKKVILAEAENDYPNKIHAFHELLQSVITGKEYYQYYLFENEGHYSLVHEATMEGLQFIYKNYPPQNIEDEFALRLHFKNLSKEFGYNITIPMDAVIDLANTFLRKQDFEKGIDIARINLELYPDQPQSHWHVGDSYALNGQYEAALPFFQKAYKKALTLHLEDAEEYKQSVEDTRKKIKVSSPGE